MSARDIVDFLLLSALWGASFLFMRVAAPEFGPASLMLLRCAIGALTLAPILWFLARDQVSVRRFVIAGLVGIVNSAVPFVLLAFAALSLTAGVLSTLNATAPFWGAMIAYLWLKERMTQWQVLGLMIGFSGVYFLVDAGPSAGSADPALVAVAVAAALAATLAYGIAANLAKRLLTGTDPLVNATASQVGAAAFLLIPGLVFWPGRLPGPAAWWSIGLLGVFSTGIAYLLFFRLIRNIGPSRAITVTFAVPVFGMLFGWIFLSERVSFGMMVAAAVIVLGCALTTRVIDPSSRHTNADLS